MSPSNTGKTSCVIRLRDNQFSGDNNKFGRIISFNPEYDDGCFVASEGGFSGETILEGKPEQIWKLLKRYDGKTLPELKKMSEESGTPIYSLNPLDSADDKSRILNEKQYPFYTIRDQAKFEDGENFPRSFRLETSNLMGVLTFTDETGFSLTLQVESRFDKTKEQPFLLYMLEKVFDFSLADHGAESTGENWLNEILLLLAFMRALENAAKAGLYKKYERVKYNDLRFRGRLDFARHIRKNFPVQDKIAYSRREITFDHCVNHLIRSAAAALEKIFPAYNNQKNDNSRQAVKDFLRDLKTITPSWQPGQEAARRLLRHRDALEPVRHSYFAETYEELRILSRMILEKETGTPYGNTGGRVSGVLFDGAWLWEEYLATVLAEGWDEEDKEFKEFIHATPLTQKGAIYTFYEDETKPMKGGSNYPDFYWEKKRILLDAKYMEGSNTGGTGQILVYLLLTGANRVGLIFPPSSKDNGGAHKEYTIRQQLDRDENNNPKMDYFWRNYQYRKMKPDDNSSPDKVRSYMEKEEKELRKWVKGLP